MQTSFFSHALPRTLISAAVASAFALAAVNASADLSSRYVDNDGDMVADAPSDESQWADPDTLVFAYTPVEDPAVYAGVWSDFLEHLSEATGKEVQFFPVQSNAAQLEALRAGRLHVAGFNTGSTPVAVNCGGFRPFAMMASDDGSFGYEMEIITYPGSGIASVEDLAGRQMAFTAETSNSGFRAPSALLLSEYGLEADKDYSTAFSGSHDNSILGVVNKDYEAAAIANSVGTRMIARGVVNEGDYEIIYTSETFPTTAYGLAHNLKPELAESIQDAFFSYDWEGTPLEAEFANSGESQFIPISYEENWSVIRTIADATGVTYDCD
ncbi:MULTISPECIES: phosphate/phosphite/phosphonate ABC transporter substrate-binding protein [unclassified Halomonas]|uniref:phosphate/phosphite/phosphonate ABC transporter substrate-binding protein n=1 Tax=unclassified Halomonas TaxID=2609666 RepID=UPI0007D94EA7|nr:MULTISPECIES: phosphate/phosphite/phosphonate ABC transporter substrate-binding protein [unclassified Halomonas]MBT2785722.1 phosphate/phosphite/phosphonate ABC transporter substrate-binding protein [Halomonas sp. ISL-106]MBT2798776.1 phosphate/phosphite/phosphonate ABC transporter substrate-binding protein [Halomonas sp. ISL-104]OAL59142.1 phosphonate ABC transporter substrate-binding protein [Halomonas sp. ALS9]